MSLLRRPRVRHAAFAVLFGVPALLLAARLGVRLLLEAEPGVEQAQLVRRGRQPASVLFQPPPPYDDDDDDE